MDNENLPKSGQDTPGAPELDTNIASPSAPVASGKQTGPVFRAEPEKIPEPAEQVVSIDTVPDPFDEDEDDDGPEAPPALDEHQARIEYLQSLRKDKPRKKGSRSFGRVLLVTGLVLVIIGAVGASVYYFYHSSRPTKKAAQTVATATQAPAQTTTDTPTTDNTDTEQTTGAELKDYTSATFGLSLTYPGDWVPEELADRLTITSPVLDLSNGSGQQTKGKIVLRVRPRQDKPAEFSGGKVVAVLPSVKVNYTKPSATQRATTYFSYLQYGATSVKGGLDGIYITGNYGYKYAQTVQLAEISKIDPLIDVTFVSCADEACATTTQKPLTLSSADWSADKTNHPIVEAMLKSLVLN